MPTAQSRANLRYYHKRRAEDPDFADVINTRRKESYERNREVELERARLYRERKKAMKLPAEKIEEKTT